MNDLLQIVVSGMALGASYALIALGFVVIYRSSQVFNFAHGEFLIIGAFSMLSLSQAGLPWPIALLGAMVITGAVAALIERLVIRPMIGRPVFVTVILTLFVANLLHAIAVVIWGVDIHGMPMPWDTAGSIKLGGAAISYNAIGAIAVGLLALALFFVLLHYTKLGVGMRATNTDQEVALALGVPVGRIFMTTWFLAGMYAALAGVFLSAYPNNLDTNLHFVAARAFPAIIVGGLTSPVGAVLAGFILGLAEVMAQRYVEPALGEFGRNIHEVFPYVIMIAFLIVRPYGLFGERDVERV